MPIPEYRRPSFFDSLTIIVAIVLLCLSASAMKPTGKPPQQTSPPDMAAIGR